MIRKVQVSETKQYYIIHSYMARLGEVTVEFSKKASPSVRSGATFRTRGQWLAAGLADIRAAPCLVTSLAGSTAGRAERFE